MWCFDCLTAQTGASLLRSNSEFSGAYFLVFRIVAFGIFKQDK